MTIRNDISAEPLDPLDLELLSPEVFSREILRSIILMPDSKQRIEYIKEILSYDPKIECAVPESANVYHVGGIYAHASMPKVSKNYYEQPLHPLMEAIRCDLFDEYRLLIEYDPSLISMVFTSFYFAHCAIPYSCYDYAFNYNALRILEDLHERGACPLVSPVNMTHALYLSRTKLQREPRLKFMITNFGIGLNEPLKDRLHYHHRLQLGYLWKDLDEYQHLVSLGLDQDLFLDHPETPKSLCMGVISESFLRYYIKHRGVTPLLDHLNCLFCNLVYNEKNIGICQSLQISSLKRRNVSLKKVYKWITSL